MEHKKILVCGAGGFIGTHLVTSLKSQGHYVIGADLKYPSFSKTDADEFHIVDLRDQTLVEKVVTSDLDEIYQLAADMGGAGFISTGDNDADIMHNSATINLNILNEMVKKGVKNVFYTSSACVYPEYNQLDPDNPKCSEDSAYPAEPDSEYGWEKLFSERLYLSYGRNYGFRVRIARLHNVFGPLGSWCDGREKAPAALCRKVIESTGEVEVWGPGNQTRSFMYIDECIEGIHKMMACASQMPINLGSDRMISINDLVLLIAKIAGKDIKIKNIPGPQGVMGRNSDNNLIKGLIGGWAPADTLEYGLKQTYNWIKSQKKIFSKTGRVYDLKVNKNFVAPLTECECAPDTIYYFHYYYDLHEGVGLLNSMEDKHWDHLRTDPTAKFIYENCNETFTYKLAHDIKQVIVEKNIHPAKIYIIVMDEVHRKFLTDRLSEIEIYGVNIGVFNDLLQKTASPDAFPTSYKFSMLSRNYRPWRLHLYAELANRDLLKDFRYSFYNIFPYGEVRYYDQETMCSDLTKHNFQLTDTVTSWLSAVPYTLDVADNVLNKWGDATYDAITQADFHVLVETHYDLSYYVPGYTGYNRKLAPSSITEKTNKPIACSKPFIVFSTPYFLEDLRTLGYESYAPFIDESYDVEEDNHKRLNMIVAEIERISSLPEDQYNELLANCSVIAARNRQKLLDRKSNISYNTQFNFLRDYFEPQSNIQIL
jgi:nucleoside-diphosphate-sugar epimerase